MNEALVSILIPTFNRAWHIERSTRSALAQSYANIEVVVVDDAGADDTAQIVQAIQDARLLYVRQPQNVGMVANWGECLERARGEYVVFLADDDELRPNFVANRLRYLSGDARVNVAFSRYDVQDQEGNPLFTCNDHLRDKRCLEGTDLLKAALSREWFVGAACYRRDMLTRLWPQVAQDDLVLDFALNIRLAMLDGYGVIVPDNDFIMMAHGGQNSQAKLAQVMQEGVDTLERILRDNPPPPFARMLRRELANWNVMWGRMLFAEGQAQTGRAHLLRALRCDLRLKWAWQQLALSCFLPQRLTTAVAPRK